jgi:hypothetical protein
MDRVGVVATRWSGGWELELDRGGVTQTRTLDGATEQVLDYLSTVEPGIDRSAWKIQVVARNLDRPNVPNQRHPRM